jgi:hypothetical protein
MRSWYHLMWLKIRFQPWSPSVLHWQPGLPLQITSLNSVPNAQVCVYLTVHITKLQLHFQHLSIYHIPNVSIGTLAAENLDVCTACDLWDSNIQLTMVKDRRPRPGMPFLDSDTCTEGGLFISARVFFPVWCHPWMDDGMDGWTGHAMPSMDGWRDGWMDGKSFTTTTSFTIFNFLCYFSLS